MRSCLLRVSSLSSDKHIEIVICVCVCVCSLSSAFSCYGFTFRRLRINWWGWNFGSRCRLSPKSFLLPSYKLLMWFLKYPFLIWVCSASHMVRFGQVPRWNPCLDVFPIFSRKTLGIDGGDIPCCGAQCYGLQCSCWPAAAEVFSGWEERFGKDLQSDVSPFILSQSSPSTTSHHPLDWDFFPRRNAEICCQQKELKFLQLDECSMGSPGPSHHNNGCFSCFSFKMFNKAWIWPRTCWFLQSLAWFEIS